MSDFPVYKVGDPDPTPLTWPRGAKLCPAQLPGPRGPLLCTWPEGHEHPQHIAAGLSTVLGAWPA